jgi:membrane protease subunit HflK
MRRQKMFDFENHFLGSLFKIIFLVLFAIIVLVTIFTGIYTLEPGQQAVVTTFGNPRLETGTGMHFKIPFFQGLEKVDVSVKGFTIGYDETTQNEEGEIVEMANPLESLMITKDMAFINVDFYVEYEIVDSVKYLYNSKQPYEIMHALTMSNIRDTVGLWGIDDVLTTGKAAITAEIQEKLTRQLNDADLGLRLVSIRMQDAFPPTSSVETAFKEVENARQEMERMMFDAQAYANEKRPAAQAQADQILKEAEAVEKTRENEATQQISLFDAQYQEYIKNPELVRSRMYWEMLERVMRGKNVIIVDDGSGTLKMLPLDQ